jgi:HSP20 family protein
MVRARYHPFRPAFSVPAFNRETAFGSATDTKSTRPAANILRKEGAYEIKLAVPGLSKDEIRIELVENNLVVSAIIPEQEVKENGFIRQEFDYSGFKRTFRLHRNANTDALKASFDQGILTIVIPDKEPETIKIDIQ